jgi:hypothetical protein
VFIPGDLDPEFDHYWGPEPQPSAAQAEAIDQVRTCRALSKRLTAARNQATKD